MSPFATIYSAGVDYLASASGEEVTYRQSGAADVVHAGAIVGNEVVIERPGQNGLAKIRRRQFSLRRSLVDAPQLAGVIVYAGENWPVKGIISRDETLTRVECELELVRDSSRGSHRPRL